jgi:hypothetical protein
LLHRRLQLIQHLHLRLKPMSIRLALRQ